MDKATADILAKVKKLMALGASPSEAEAASALEKARTLLARYGLSLTDVEAHSPDVVEGVLLEKKRLRSWESHLIHVISACTFTQALHVQRGGIGQVLLVGRELNTLAAKDLFGYLHLVVLKLGRAHSAEVYHLESFRRGAVQRIGERLLDLSAGTEETGGIWAGTSIDAKETKNEKSDAFPADKPGVRSDRQITVQMEKTTGRENQAFIAEKYGKTTNKRVGRRVDAESYHKGRSAGDGVSLNRQLT
jgi:hypothetical protein